MLAYHNFSVQRGETSFYESSARDALDPFRHHVRFFPAEPTREFYFGQPNKEAGLAGSKIQHVDQIFLPRGDFCRSGAVQFKPEEKFGVDMVDGKSTNGCLVTSAARERNDVSNRRDLRYHAMVIERALK